MSDNKWEVEMIKVTKMGRPKVEDPKDYRFSVRFKTEQIKKIDAYARKHGMKRAEVIRYGVEKLLESDNA